MASLDDFFAKKDKKKSKKKQYKAASSLADGSGDGENPVAVVEVEKSKKAKGRIAEYNDDSWNDTFQEEKAPDFSGLKISTTVAKEEPVAAPVAAPEPESEDETEPQAETVDWATGETRPTEDNTPDPTMPNVAGGKYVPPSSRGFSSGLGRRGPQKQQAPDLGTMSFPTLGAAVADAGSKTKSGDEFQQVGPGQGARASHNPNRYQPPNARGVSNGYAGLDRRGNDGDRW